MILKGNQRGSGRELAIHLMNVEDNEHVIIHELRGFLANDLMEAFIETEAVSLGTKCEQYLFSLSLNPPQMENVRIEAFEKVIDEIERRLGLSGQPRAIIFHEKKGRRHAHCVWSRINVDEMRGINLPFFKSRLMDISREIYLEYGWEMPAGLRDRDNRDPLNYSREEAGQAKRVKRDPTQLKELFKSCWETSDSRTSFAAALWEHGFYLARGDRRGFVAVDPDREIYSLPRWCGVKAKVLRSRLGDNTDLPSVEEALERLQKHHRGKEYSESQVLNDHHNEFLRDHEQKLSDVIARQRRERRSLSDSQEVRRIEEIKLRKSRLPKGLKAIWAKVTGDYHKLVEKCVEEAKACEDRDRRETEILINRHLTERRGLDHRRDYLLAQHALEREFLDPPSSNIGQTYSPDPRQNLVLPAEDFPFTPAQLQSRPELILDHISDKQAFFCRNDIVKGLSDFIEESLELRVAVDRVLASSELIKASDEKGKQFTTQDFQKTQEQLLNRVDDMVRSGGFHVNLKHIKKAIKSENGKLKNKHGASLSTEQIKAIEHVLSPHQLCSVVGLAGTGKSTLLSVAREAWEKQGFHVYGATLAGKAADSLQQASGIASRTLASLEASWKSGYEPIEPGSILVVDEAGMVGTRQLTRITGQLEQRGCKLVLVGDPHQLQPIQAGTPFKDIVDAHEAARLTEIRRQSEEWQRQASRDLAIGHTDMALRNYADHGCIHETKDRDKAIATLVDAYISDWEKHGFETSQLALAHRRKDVHAINQAIKSARNQLTQKPVVETLFETDHGPRAFGSGDRILFTRNDANLGVQNGMLGTVEIVEDQKITVRLDSDDAETGRKLTFSPRESPSFDHGFAVSIHRSQGCTVDRSYILSSTTLDKNLTYVAFTRHREKTGFYTAPDIDSPKTSRNKGYQRQKPQKRQGPRRAR